MSADYQLLPPTTGHDIIRDISDLLTFLLREDLGKDEGGTVGEADVTQGETLSHPQRPLGFTIDPEAIAIAGSSAGGLCAYLAAMHCTAPKPRAILSIFGMGGNFIVRTPSPPFLLYKS